ncbi:MAG: hypothetical protein QM719_12115 [Thermomonas sp.]
MDPIPLEDLALLEVLQRIDQGMELSDADSDMHQRLIDSGLAIEGEEGLQLTAAGIELCKSLQHRVAADNLKAAAESGQD